MMRQRLGYIVICSTDVSIFLSDGQRESLLTRVGQLTLVKTPCSQLRIFWGIAAMAVRLR